MSELKQKLIRRLEAIPGISHQPWPDRNDGFSVLLLNGKEVAHFHNFHEIDLRLGKKFIKDSGLKHYADSIKHPKRSPNSQFIEIRFHNAKDVNKIVKLVNQLVADTKK